MKTITLRPAEPERDFGQLAELFSSEEEQQTTEAGLRQDYEKSRERIINRVAEDPQGELLGFHWALRDRVYPDRFYVYLIVKPVHRRQGVGRRLYQDLAGAVASAGARRMQVTLRETCPECRAFAERRGFIERIHSFPMTLDLAAFDDRPYDAIIDSLKGQGFQFTSMEQLGDTEEARRRLYRLNDTAAATTPGSDGEHSWGSFDDFQTRVCSSDWYKPGGQMVVIETATGEWAAMSAITRFEGTDYAYNLFTGVDPRYRGRKLGQAVKVVALRYARQALQVDRVRTHHNTLNLPMIAIDRKFGYVSEPGVYVMEAVLE